MSCRSKQRILKRGTQMVKRHVKKCSTFSVIREMQLKTTLRFHLTLVRVLRSIAQVTAHTGEDVKQGDYSSIAGKSAKSHSHCGSQYGRSPERWELIQRHYSWAYTQRMFCPTTETLAQLRSLLIQS